MSRTRRVQTHRDRKRWGKWRACLSLFFDIKVIVRKEFVLAGQTANTAYYYDLFMATAWKYAKTSPRPLATKELALSSRHRTISHFLFTSKFCTKNVTTAVPTHPTSLCFLDGRRNWKAAILTQLWSRQNRRRCWTPSQNTTSRMHLKNCRSSGNGKYTRKGTTSRVVVVFSRPKVNFWPDGLHQFRKLWMSLCRAENLIADGYKSRVFQRRVKLFSPWNCSHVHYFTLSPSNWRERQMRRPQDVTSEPVRNGELSSCT
jgi:hypothetical protein